MTGSSNKSNGLVISIVEKFLTGPLSLMLIVLSIILGFAALPLVFFIARRYGNQRFALALTALLVGGVSLTQGFTLPWAVESRAYSAYYIQRTYYTNSFM